MHDGLLEAAYPRVGRQPRARGRAGVKWLGTWALLMGIGEVENCVWTVGSAALRRLFQSWLFGRAREGLLSPERV